MEYSWSCYLCKIDPLCRHTWSLHQDKVLDSQDNHHTGYTPLLAYTACTCSLCFHSPPVQESCIQVHMDILLRYQRREFPQVYLQVHIHGDNQKGQDCTPRICYNLKEYWNVYLFSLYVFCFCFLRMSNVFYFSVRNIFNLNIVFSLIH